MVQRHTIPLLKALIVDNETLNPKEGGGGSYVPTAQEIACHFSQDHARVL